MILLLLTSVPIEAAGDQLGIRSKSETGDPFGRRAGGGYISFTKVIPEHFPSDPLKIQMFNNTKSC